MFDPKFKSFCFVSSYVGKKQGVSIVHQYDKRMLYPILVKSNNHLHLVENVVFGFANQDAYRGCGLNIFQMNSNNIRTTKEIVTRELLDFVRFHVDVKDIKNLLQWLEKDGSRFRQLTFLQSKIWEL